ncbi:MAG: hypothetical protein L6Q26_09305 [Anaerolineales bacterium]|nr:hypothetical protein [Anaerolineales bacterium]NUQ84600.1 hypothetical protein [Anaerolineales bacterium]
MHNIPKTMQADTVRQFAFLQRLSISRERSARAITGLDEKLICAEPIARNWTVKDMLGRVVTWDDEFKHATRRILGCDKPPKPSLEAREIDWNEWNTIRAAEKGK